MFVLFSAVSILFISLNSWSVKWTTQTWCLFCTIASNIENAFTSYIIIESYLYYAICKFLTSNVFNVRVFGSFTTNRIYPTRWNNTIQKIDDLKCEFLVTKPEIFCLFWIDCWTEEDLECCPWIAHILRKFGIVACLEF